MVFTEGALRTLDAQARATMESLIPRGKAGAPGEIAHALLMLAQPSASHITGQILIVDGGQSLGTVFRQ